MRVLFADTVHACLEEELLRHGFETAHYTGKSREGLKAIIGDYEGIVIRSKVKLDADMLQHANRLRFIARAGAGMENIDIPFAESMGIACINSPEGNRDAVGEHAIGMLLMLLNNLKRADAEVRKGIWVRAENRGFEIMGKTIGLIGYGNTGSQIAKKLSGFEAEILVYDKYLSGFSNSYCRESTLEEIQEKADILSLHIPLTPETHYLVDEAFIRKFRKNFFFMNTSRGKNVKTAALAEALKSGKICGACLDVIEYESISFEQLDAAQLPEDYRYILEAENVILSPHIAGWTHESNEKMSRILAEKIIVQFGKAS